MTRASTFLVNTDREKSIVSLNGCAFHFDTTHSAGDVTIYATADKASMSARWTFSLLSRDSHDALIEEVIYPAMCDFMLMAKAD